MSCEYCFEKLSSERYNLVLGCGHVICKNCVEFIKRNYDRNQCPFDHQAYSQLIEDLPIHKASIELMKPLCHLHKVPLLYYSKLIYSKVCLQCIEEKNISKIDVYAVEGFSEFLTEKTTEIKKCYEALSETYSKCFEFGNFFERVSMHADVVKKTSSLISITLCEKNIDYKLGVLQSCKDSSNISRSDIDVFKVLEIDEFKVNLELILLPLALAREKMLMNSNDLCIWTGKALKTSKSIDGFYRYKYQIISPGPFKITALGLGTEVGPAKSRYFTSIIIQGKSKVTVPVEFIKSREIFKVVQEYLVGSEVIMNSGEIFEILISMKKSNWYNSVTIPEITFQDWKIIHLDAQITREVMYFKFERV